MSWQASIELDASLLSNSQLRPYNVPRNPKIPKKFAMYVCGSTIAAAWIEILAFSLYATTLYLLIHFLHWDEFLSTKFPQDFKILSDFLSAFSSTGITAIGFISGAAVFGAFAKYAAGITVIYNLNSTVVTFATFVSTYTKHNLLGSEICNEKYNLKECNNVNIHLKTQITRSVKKVHAIQIFEEIQAILRAYAYAFKHNARTQIAESRYESTVTSADVNLKDAKVDPFKLPMPKYLQVELFSFDSDYLTGLLNMVTKRTRILYQLNVMSENSENIGVLVNSLSNISASIDSIQVLGLAPPLKNLFFQMIYLTFIINPLPLWINYKFFGLIIYIAELLFIFSLYGISRKVGNPFDRRDNSYFIYHDIGYLVHEAARAVDSQMDKTIGESISMKNSGICCIPKTTIDNCAKTDKHNNSTTIEFIDSSSSISGNVNQNNENSGGLLAAALLEFNNSNTNKQQNKLTKNNDQLLNVVIDV